MGDTAKYFGACPTHAEVPNKTFRILAGIMYVRIPESYVPN